MATAVTAPNRSATVLTRSTFTLTDKLRIQRQRIHDREYVKFATLTTIVIERQLPTKGISQSKPRWQNPQQERMHRESAQMTGTANFDAPFSDWQATNWALLTLEWLSHKNGSLLAISRDKNDLLLPRGLAALPKIPDPLWTPAKGGTTAPRVEQKLEDRACGRIYERHTGKFFLIFQPLTELCVMVGSADPKKGGFGRIRCVTDPATRLHASLLVNPDPMDRYGNLEAYFASGAFEAGQ
jgi:hypothetical protein